MEKYLILHVFLSIAAAYKPDIHVGSECSQIHTHWCALNMCQQGKKCVDDSKMTY